jgi:hypothetical protein
MRRAWREPTHLIKAGLEQQPRLNCAPLLAMLSAEAAAGVGFLNICTADYQPTINHAYKADRGPVTSFSGRLHGEF